MKRSYGFVAYALASPLVASVRNRHRSCSSSNAAEIKGDARRVRVLLVRTRLGRWDFPKGTFEPSLHCDRTPLDTAKRELREETGLDPEKAIIGIDTSEQFTFEYTYSISNGRQVKKEVVLYLCRLRDEVLSPVSSVSNGLWCISPSRLSREPYKTAHSNNKSSSSHHQIDNAEVSCHDFVWLDELASRFTYPEDSALAARVAERLRKRCEQSVK